MLVKVVYWVKNSESDFGCFCRKWVKKILNPQVPVIPLLHHALFSLHKTVVNLIAEFLRVLYFTPLFKSQVKGSKSNLYLYSGMPLLLGNLEIILGNDVRMSGITTFCGRACSAHKNQLLIGNNVDIGWQNSISVGTKVVIENDVRLAGKVFLAGYPGHPIDNADRAAGKPDLDEQVGDIIIKQGAWLGTGVTVLAGVTIGCGAIIGAGAVVTKDIPDNCIAAGNPARIVKSLK
jgi:acetyltransferase-like isoleucine patch superfamily enzyme